MLATKFLLGGYVVWRCIALRGPRQGHRRYKLVEIHARKTELKSSDTPSTRLKITKSSQWILDPYWLVDSSVK